MHAGGFVVVNLAAIHADVAFAGVGVFGDGAGTSLDHNCCDDVKIKTC